jgi:hypothetical protein
MIASVPKNEPLRGRDRSGEVSGTGKNKVAETYLTQTPKTIQRYEKELYLLPLLRRRLDEQSTAHDEASYSFYFRGFPAVECPGRGSERHHFSKK